MTQVPIVKRAGLGVALLCVLILACGSDAYSIATAGTLSKKQSLVHQGRLRSFRLYVPDPPPKQPCAAVLLLHGHGGSADQLLGVTGRQAPYRVWMPLADRDNFVLIAPDGLVGPDGKQGWNDARNIATNPDSNDVEFLIKLVETIARAYPIDSSRVYATGTSNGGHMVLRLAAEAPDRFAAVAAVAAANPDPIFRLKPKNPISVLLMNGTNDRILPYGGGKMIHDRGNVQSTDESVRYWSRHNGCEEKPQSFEYPDDIEEDRCTASRRTYRNAALNVEVAVIQIRGGGHTEPSVEQRYSRPFLAIVGKQNQDIEMANEVWNFFQDKSASAQRTSR